MFAGRNTTAVGKKCWRKERDASSSGSVVLSGGDGAGESVRVSEERYLRVEEPSPWLSCTAQGTHHHHGCHYGIETNSFVAQPPASLVQPPLSFHACYFHTPSSTLMEKIPREIAGPVRVEGSTDRMLF